MAQLQWSRPATVAAAPQAPALLRRLAGRFLDWEDWLTLALAVGAVAGVALPLEHSGWSRDTPSLTQVGLLALVAALLLARSPLPAYLAWPVAAVAGAAATSWQTLELVGPGDLGQRVDAIYFRFQRWFDLAFSGGISNDPLPFNVLVVGLTWLGVFAFGWALFRWHDAWLGLIPGGIALFFDLVFVEERTPPELSLFIIFGFLLLMRANLAGQISRWRKQGVTYPPLISVSFLHFTAWMGLVLLLGAWIAPVGPFPTPGVVEAVAGRFEGVGVVFVRLAGPLHVKTIVPVHDYTALLPFQGSIDLGERELLGVRVTDPTVGGPILLRGAAYDQYASGGWKAGPRQEQTLRSGASQVVGEELRRGDVQGRLVPIHVEVEAKSVVGTVLFTPGQVVSATVPAVVDAPAASVRSVRVYLAGGGTGLSDAEVLARWAPGGTIGVEVVRDGARRVRSLKVIDADELGLPDAQVVRPREALAKGESYDVVGLLREAPPEKLRDTGWNYPTWVVNQYGTLPDSVPERVLKLSREVAGQEETPYDRAKAIEGYLRKLPVDYSVGETPPGEDTVDYFLFEAKRGYFDYHASAMVVMLRAVGVPARLAVGFVADKPDSKGLFTVRDKDAYAWAEVYFPGYGWVEFNPSPDRPADLRPAEKPQTPLTGAPQLDDFPNLPATSGGVFPITGGDEATGGAAGPGSAGAGYAPWALLIAAAVVAAAAGSVALGWRQSVAGLPYAQQVWEKTVRLATWAGLGPQPGQTPTDFAGGLGRRFRDLPDLPLLAAAYNRSRFGRREPDEADVERLREMWPHLRGALLAGILRRLWRRR
ncbi:MAG TPA: transglutaminase domain-containing protein [Dehalococcoidia bacterium]|nr:transglutaminase domain-containing protein [Dehalococcoidia bacterium]